MIVDIQKKYCTLNPDSDHRQPNRTWEAQDSQKSRFTNFRSKQLRVNCVRAPQINGQKNSAVPRQRTFDISSDAACLLRSWLHAVHTGSHSFTLVHNKKIFPKKSAPKQLPSLCPLCLCGEKSIPLCALAPLRLCVKNRATPKSCSSR